MVDVLDDLVLDFDLNFLQQSSNDTVTPALCKQRNQGKPNKKLVTLKRKIISTSTLIEKFNENKEILTHTENLLIASKEECRQVCIDYKNALEKCASVEKEVEILKSKFLSVEAKSFAEKNNNVAAESYTKQLQLLLKERDDLIESLKEESKAEKAHVRELEKTISLLRKDKEVLSKNIHHLANLIFYKKTPNKRDKTLASKYINNETHVGVDSLSEEEISESEIDDFDELSVPSDIEHLTETKKVISLPEKLVIKHEKKLKQINTKKHYNDHDSDVGSEVVSLDTGRGSSLEFSDSEKCFNSPDYFTADSPFSVELNKAKQVDSATSPITVPETTETLKTSVIFGSNTTSTRQNKKGDIYKVDRATSPIKLSVASKAIGTSPIRKGSIFDEIPVAKIFVDKATSPVKLPIACKAAAASPEVSIFDEIPASKIVEKIVTPTKQSLASRITPRRGINNKKICDEFSIPKTAVDKGASPIKLPLVCKNTTRRAINKISLFEEIPSSEIAVGKDVNPTKLPLASRKAVKRAVNKKESVYHKTPATICTVDKAVSPTKFSLVSRKSPRRATKKETIFEEISFKSTFGQELNEIPTKLHPASRELAKRALDLESLFNEDDSSTKLPPADWNAARRDIDMEKVLGEIPVLKTTVDRAVSPIKLLTARKDTATSPIKCLNNTDSVYLSGNHKIQIPECLESHNRSSSCIYNSDDHEIEMILNTMRFTHELVTPIPPTPTIPICTRAKVQSKKNDKHYSNEIDNVLNTDSELITIIEVIESPTPSEKSGIIDENKENSKNISAKHTLLNISKQLQFEEEVDCNTMVDKIVEDESILINAADTIHEIAGNKNIKKGKPKNLTRLQKLRKTLIPQNKIKTDVLPPTRKLRARLQQLQVNREKAKASELKASLSNEEAFQRAVKIMAELKLKENTTKVKTINGKKRHSVPNLSISKTDNENKDKETRVSNSILTRSRTERSSLSCDKNVVDVLTRIRINEAMNEIKLCDKVQVGGEAEMSPNLGRKRTKRSSIDKPLESSTRILRSYTRRMSEEGKSDSEKSECNRTDKVIQTCQSPSVPQTKSDSKENEVERTDKVTHEYHSPSVTETTIQSIQKNANSPSNLVNYNDLDLFADEPCSKKIKIHENNNNTAGIILNPQDSVLCKMIDKHGITIVKNMPKKIPESVIKAVCKKLDDGITYIIKLPMIDTKNAMNKLADDMRRWTWKEFLRGLMLYLMDPTRKLELFNKINGLHAPAMTNSEQVLLYIVTRLRACWPDIDLVDCIFSQIEYTLFKLNHAPEFEAIESMSHFYAILCKYVKAKNRLRIFVLDAMYCLQFKAVPLIKQCIEVWFHILPLAHMGIAKSPLVTCIVYLLHYYKCEDKYNRVQDIRNLLHQKYYFQITDWNETKILEMFKNAIHDLRDNPIERKMMRLALIVLAKRQGPQWCQKKLIKNIILPLIDGSQAGVSDIVKAFCVSMLGPLLKPYPMDMKVHCEIILNQLIDMLDDKHSPRLQEAIYSSLISMSKHNQTRVIQALLLWHPEKISPDTEDVIKCYVKEKPVRVWKTILSKISLVR